LNSTASRGFLKGFIDLTFEHDGRWYIADYKSSWLARTPANTAAIVCYNPGVEHYLQEVLVCWWRYGASRSRLDDSQRSTGWCFYLFLRGMPERWGQLLAPGDGLLDALDTLFRGGKMMFAE
jgi:exodeoxyribonuclease V beta subunit